MMRGLLAALIPRNRLVLSAGDKATTRHAIWIGYSGPQYKILAFHGNNRKSHRNRYPESPGRRVAKCVALRLGGFEPCLPMVQLCRKV